jgi:hypothetical protein
MSITVSKAFADNRSVGEIKLPAALFNKTSTLPKLSIRFATCFLLLHNDVHHIVGKHVPPFSSSDAVFLVF